MGECDRPLDHTHQRERAQHSYADISSPSKQLENRDLLQRLYPHQIKAIVRLNRYYAELLRSIESDWFGYGCLVQGIDNAEFAHVVAGNHRDYRKPSLINPLQPMREEVIVASSFEIVHLSRVHGD
ncbi:hypothetical protein D3C77_385460 [compost metagenome]